VASKKDVRVTPYRDGPLLVRGPVRVLDDQGRELNNRRDPIALCRCGKSRLRPFCDGTHKLIGFRAAGAPGSAADGFAELERLGFKLSEQGRPALRPALQQP
jgi:CDGSH-type Zn-finger protein